VERLICDTGIEIVGDPMFCPPSVPVSVPVAIKAPLISVNAVGVNCPTNACPCELVPVTAVVKGAANADTGIANKNTSRGAKSSLERNAMCDSSTWWVLMS